jgi:hypothetical protein
MCASSLLVYFFLLCEQVFFKGARSVLQLITPRAHAHSGVSYVIGRGVGIIYMSAKVS